MLDTLFRNTLSPTQWAILAAVPPLILALYFLKLKRVPVEVPSTYLWLKAIEDLHVNSLWQRLRRSVLLLLQLLLVALAMLALLRPGWQGTRLTGERFIFLVDNSASMGATDVDAKHRLAVAKRAVVGLVDQLERNMSAMIISFAGQPRVVQEFTDNRRRLRDAAESIELTPEPTNLLEALKLAEGLANPGQLAVEEGGPEVEIVDPVDAGLFLMTDGRGGAVKGFTLGRLDPVFVPIGSTESANLAITAMSTRRTEAASAAARLGERQAYVQVTNLSHKPARIVVDLSLAAADASGHADDDWRLLDAQGVDVPAGESTGLTFPLADPPAGKLRAEISPESLAAVGDALAIDNTAYAALNDAEPGRVLLVGPGNNAIETALSTGRASRFGMLDSLSPDKLGSKEHLALARSGAYNLIIYDRCAPKEMPRANTLFVGAAPPSRWRGDGPPPTEEGAEPQDDWVGEPIILDWNRSHPLLAYVELSNVLVARALRVDPPQGAAVLIDSDSGPLMAIAARDSYEDAVLALPILDEEDGATVANTNWFTKRSFPTFWLNVLEYFVGQAGDPARSQAAPGRSIEIKATSDVNQISVTSPSGERQTLRRVGDAPFQYQQTDEPGVYEVSEPTAGGGERVARRFAVNLFDRAESDVRLRVRAGDDPLEADTESLEIGFVRVAATAGAAPARKELWRPLLVAVLVLLLLEWYVYNRRVYV